MRLPVHSPQLKDSAPPIKRALLMGNSGVFSLAHAWTASYLARGQNVFLLDCAIRFQMDTMVHLLPQPLEHYLRKLVVQRAFTPYQILDAVQKLHQRSRPYDLHVILAPAKQFFDGDVGDQECGYLLGILAKKLYHLPASTKIIVVEKDQYSHAQFPRFSHRLQQAMSQFWYLSQGKELIYKPKKIQNQGEHHGQNHSTLFSTTRTYQKSIPRLSQGFKKRRPASL